MFAPIRAQERNPYTADARDDGPAILFVQATQSVRSENLGLLSNPRPHQYKLVDFSTSQPISVQVGTRTTVYEQDLTILDRVRKTQRLGALVKQSYSPTRDRNQRCGV